MTADVIIIRSGFGGVVNSGTAGLRLLMLERDHRGATPCRLGLPELARMPLPQDHDRQVLAVRGMRRNGILHQITLSRRRIWKFISTRGFVLSALPALADATIYGSVHWNSQ